MSWSNHTLSACTETRSQVGSGAGRRPSEVTCGSQSVCSTWNIRGNSHCGSQSRFSSETLTQDDASWFCGRARCPPRLIHTSGQGLPVRTHARAVLLQSRERFHTAGDSRLDPWQSRPRAHQLGRVRFKSARLEASQPRLLAPICPAHIAALRARGSVGPKVKCPGSARPVPKC